MLTDESGNSLSSVLPGLQTLLSDARPPPTLAIDLGPFIRLVPPDAATPSGAREQTAESESAFCAPGHPALSSTLPPTTSTPPPTFRRRVRSTPSGRRPGGRRQQSPPAHRRPSRAEPVAQPTRAAHSWQPPPLAELQPGSVSLLPDRSSGFSRARRALREAGNNSNYYRLEGFLPPLTGLSFNERYSIRYSGFLVARFDYYHCLTFVMCALSAG